MVATSLPRARLVLWASLVPLTYLPLYTVLNHPPGWAWLPLVSTLIALGAVALLLRSDGFDRAAVVLAPHAGRILALAILLYVAGSVLAARVRLESFAEASQVGLFGQSYWTLLRGHPFSNSGETVDGSLGSHLGVHFSPTLLLLAPLYALAPVPLTLIGAQALIVALSVVPLYRLLARDMGEAGAALFALALLAQPNFYWAGVHDFRDANFLPVLLITACWALEQRRHALLAAASIGALGVREEAGLAIFMLGVYALLRAHGWRVGFALMALGVVWVAAVGPFMSRLFWTPSLWADPRRLFEMAFGHWGSTPLDALRGMAADPVRLVGSLVNGENVRYVYRLLSPLLLVPPLLDPVWIVGLPNLALNMLSQFSWARSPGLYHSIVPTTFFALAMTRAAVRSSWHVPIARRSAFSLGLGLVVLAGALPALPLTSYQTELPIPPAGPTRAVLALIPEDASVYAPVALYPSLCNRESFGCWDALKENGRKWSMRGKYEWFVVWPEEFPPEVQRDRQLADSLASDPRFDEVPGFEPYRVFKRR